MKVSVIVPAYNEEDYIGDCLESLMNQLEKPDEIIVINNNSKDKTAEIAAKYPVKVINETQQGMTFARNAGFNAATGDIIARCDADAVAPPDWIQYIKKSFNNEKIDALTGSAYFYDLGESRKGKSRAIHHFLFFALTKLIVGHYPFYGPNIALKRDVWLKIRDEVCLDDKKVHEDVDLAMHFHKHGVIKYDTNFLTSVSARRMKKNPFSFFIEYPIRWVYTMLIHNHNIPHGKSTT